MEKSADEPLESPCDGCPEQQLQRHLGSPVGQLISLVIDLDAALQVGITLRLSDVTFTEFLLLRQIAEERDRAQVEEMKKRR